MTASNSLSDSHVESCFLSAVARVADSFIEEQAVIEQTMGFCVEMIGSLVPIAMFQADSLLRLQDRVFGNASLRDFIFRLTNQFLLRLTDHPLGRDNYDDLVKRLAFSLDLRTEGGESLGSRMTSTDDGSTFLPTEVLKAMPTVSTILDTLQNNKWLVTILMIHYYMPMPQPVETPQDKRGVPQVPPPGGHRLS